MVLPECGPPRKFSFLGGNFNFVRFGILHVRVRFKNAKLGYRQLGIGQIPDDPTTTYQACSD